MKDKFTYIISNISVNQLYVIMNALEAYSKIGIMEFNSVINDLFVWRTDSNTISDSYIENQNLIEQCCTDIRNILLKKEKRFENFINSSNKNWSLGISSDLVNKDVKISKEMSCQIKKLFNHDNNQIKLTDETPINVGLENERKKNLLKILHNLNESTRKDKED